MPMYDDLASNLGQTDDQKVVSWHEMAATVVENPYSQPLCPVLALVL